jgi:hypothetical protein
MSDLESKILARELGKLGGFGAKWAARFLPTVPFEATIEVSAVPANVRATVMSLLSELGHTDPSLPELSVITSSGNMNLNPTIITFAIAPSDSGARVSIRAVAKEGIVKQESAKKAVERLTDLLQKRYA